MGVKLSCFNSIFGLESSIDRLPSPIALGNQYESMELQQLDLTGRRAKGKALRTKDQRPATLDALAGRLVFLVIVSWLVGFSTYRTIYYLVA